MNGYVIRECGEDLHKRISSPGPSESVELGANVLEIGPGPGVTTACLGELALNLTCVEIDAKYASSLARRMARHGIRVLAGDGAAMPLAEASFDTVVCFTMLHHVPSTALQDRLLREAMRVLRPGGTFAGTDGVAGTLFRLFHFFETITPVNPNAFAGRLGAAGFDDVEVDVLRRDFRFRAHKPAEQERLGGPAPKRAWVATTIQRFWDQVADQESL